MPFALFFETVPGLQESHLIPKDKGVFIFLNKFSEIQFN